MGNRMGRYLTLALLTLLAALACGGRSLEQGDGSAAAGSSAGAQGNFAGAQNASGAQSSAGATQSSAGATQSSAGATQSSAGATQSSAGATQSSAGATQATGGSDTGTCQFDEDCTLFPKGCCGTREPVDASQLVAVNVANAASEKARCPTNLPCPAPAGTGTEYDQTLKYFRATCAHPPNQPGQCQVLDVRGSSYTSCTLSSECVLREGVECCPGCDGQGWVPVNSSIPFCSPGMSCAATFCISLPPVGLETSCQAGACRFVPPKR